MSPILKFHQKCIVTKTRISSKLKCHQNCNVTKTEMLPNIIMSSKSKRTYKTYYIGLVCICDAIRRCQEIQCLLYKGFSSNSSIPLTVILLPPFLPPLSWAVSLLPPDQGFLPVSAFTKCSPAGGDGLRHLLTDKARGRNT